MNQLAVTLVVLLLPGIIAAIVFDKITSHSKWDAFKFGLYSLVLGIICYSLEQLICWGADIVRTISKPLEWSILTIWNSALKTESSLSAIEVCVAVLLSLPVAFIASYLMNHKVFNKLAGRLGVSQKFGDENLFSYFMNGKDVAWVYVRDKESGMTYSGDVVSFAENGTCHEVVLADVRVYSYEESDFLYSVQSLYLCRPFGSIVIEAIANKDLVDE
mgnify:CR=1 FL=1